MKVRIAKASGFCFGVKRAMDLALEAAQRKSREKIFTDGPLIHNPQALKMLRKRGVVPLQEEKNNIGSTVIIRSHGVSPQRRRELDKISATVVDATCPKVKKVQSIIAKFAQRGFFVIIVGDGHHAEVQGLLGYAGKRGMVIQSEQDLTKLPLGKKLCVVAQTTQSRKNFFSLTEKIKERFPETEIFDTICEANRNRQEELKRLCPFVDAVIVVGGKESANTQRLVKIAQSKRVPTFFVESETDLDLDKLKHYKEVGVIGGASTPDWSLKRVVSKLEKTGNNNH